MAEEKPQIAFLRLPQVLEIFPISRSSWWQGCKSGKYPKPIKLGPRTTVWRKDEIEKLAEKFSSGLKAHEKNRKPGAHCREQWKWTCQAF